MGWTVLYHPLRTYAEQKAEVLRNCEPLEVLQIAHVAPAWYMAARRLPNPEVFALIFLTNNSKGEFAIKTMDETVGPNEARAPKSLIAKLSPTTSKYALDWRQRCLDYASRPRFKPGDRITLTNPVHFKGYPPQTEFIGDSYFSRGKPRFCWLNTTIGKCRLSQRSLRGAIRA